MNRFAFIIITLLLNCMLSTPAFAEFKAITSHEAFKIFEEQRADVIFIDLRTEAAYNLRHIKNSKSMNYYSKQFQENIDKLDKTPTYIIYCRPGMRSARTFQVMKKLGFSNVYHMTDGMKGWIENKLPVEVTLSNNKK